MTEMKMKFKVGDWVFWKDGERTMKDVVVQAYVRITTPNSYYIRVGTRTFMRYEPSLWAVSG